MIESCQVGDVKVVVANVTSKATNLRLGGKVIVYGMPGECGRVFVAGLSVGGRRISTWTSIRYLGNARVRKMPWEVYKRGLPMVHDADGFWSYHGRSPEQVAQLINDAFRLGS